MQESQLKKMIFSFFVSANYMKKKRLPSSLRKYIRFEKARIRREFLSIDEQNEAIVKLKMKHGIISSPVEEKETEKEKTKK